MLSRMGLSLCPSGVRAYSTVGGEVGLTSRVTTPLFSSSFSRVVKTLAEIFDRSLLRSPKRRGSVRKYHKIWGVQAPASNLRLASKGHPTGGGPDLLARWRIITFLSIRTSKGGRIKAVKPQGSYLRVPT